MSNINSKMKIKETLEFSDGTISVPHTSGRLIGELTIDEYDAYGRKLFSNKEYNDITLPGSVFILEQMFKTRADTRFLHPTNIFPTGTYENSTNATIDFNPIQIADKDFLRERVFGFMVGNGGEDGSGVIAPKYETINLNKNGNVTFLPFIIDDKDEITKGYPERNEYALSVESDDKKYYYVKKFKKLAEDTEQDAEIFSKWADGSGDVSLNEYSMYNAPILTYAQCILDISATDLRAFFGESNLDVCMINQLGLVAGYPVQDENGNETGEYEDIKLVTTVNFKSRDLSNSENRLQITYKIYCL